jgi:hypothetical protein
MVALRRLAAAAAAAALSAALLPGPAGLPPAAALDKRARLQASSSAAGVKPQAWNLQHNKIKQCSRHTQSHMHTAADLAGLLKRHMSVNDSKVA